MKCQYCGKKTKKNFCSEKCIDNYQCVVAVGKVKGIIMDTMREVSGKKKRREKIFLKSLITCLKLDLEEIGG